MSDADERHEIRRLLAAVGAVADRLAANERDLFETLGDKYAGHGEAEIAFDDRLCLEVILRNVAVRDP